MNGVLYGVGVGPGDYELITLKAVRILRECDIIAIPAKNADKCTAYKIALGAVPDIVNKEVLCISVPMTTDSEKLECAYRDGSLKIEAMLKKGKSIAFINLGDPAIYGTYMKIHKEIEKRGYKCYLISGVPSFCAVAAELGIPISTGSESIHILPGLYKSDEVTKYEGTKILMKSGGGIGDVKNKLIEMEEKGIAKAYAVTNCGMEGQEICKNIKELDENSGYFTTIIVKEN
ncbi:MAG: precorrin-2 C(20)-methyltransferase [Clostridia bacterium]|nr:precorrin-2 C(20)-methyltransferase [Clostridia bacterium]